MKDLLELGWWLIHLIYKFHSPPAHLVSWSMPNFHLIRGKCTSRPYFQRCYSISQKLEHIWAKWLMGLIRIVLRNSELKHFTFFFLWWRVVELRPELYQNQYLYFPCVAICNSRSPIRKPQVQSVDLCALYTPTCLCNLSFIFFKESQKHQKMVG